MKIDDRLVPSLTAVRSRFGVVVLWISAVFLLAVCPIAAAEDDPPGLTDVIVVLRAPEFEPEGKLNRAALNHQRGRIAELQETVGARSFNGEAFRVHRYVTIPAVSLRASTGLLGRLASDPDVVSIEIVQLREMQLSTSGPLIRAPESWSFGFSGQGQVVAVVDSGVDSAHPFLQGKVLDEACFSSNQYGATSLCPNGLPEMFGPGSAAPCPPTFGLACSHGTHVAGIAVGNGAAPANRPYSGIAKDAKFIAVQVFQQVNSDAQCGGSAPCVRVADDDFVAALDWVQQKKLEGMPIAAVNASLGGCCASSRAACDNFLSFKFAVDNLVSSGVAVVGVAGNSGRTDGAVATPLCQTGVTIVGASTSSDTIAPVSNSSPLVNLVAPGASIESSIVGASYAVMGGTSMAAPHVAGAFAVLRQRSPRAPASILQNDLFLAGVAIVDSRNGLTFSRIDLRAALDRADVIPPTAPGGFTAHVTAQHLVQMAWTAATDNVAVDHYSVYRRSQVADPWEVVATTTPAQTSYGDPIVELDARHYQVAAVDAYGNETASVTRAVVDAPFTTLVPSMPVAASHLRELRTAIRLLRDSAGLSTPLTDPDDNALNGLRIKAVHLTELRLGLAQALTAIGAPAMSPWTDPDFVAGATTIKRVHFQELQERLK